MPDDKQALIGMLARAGAKYDIDPDYPDRVRVRSANKPEWLDTDSTYVEFDFRQDQQLLNVSILG